MKVKVSFGASAYSNKLITKELSVNSLYRKLSKPIIREKKDGDFFIFASFKGRLRNAEEVDKYYGITLDFDNTTISINDAKKLFKEYSYLIHTTFSHKAEGAGIRYRLIMPYSKTITADQHSILTVELMRQIGVADVDDSSKAKARLMYLPSCPTEREKYFRVIKNKKDKYFNPFTILDNLETKDSEGLVYSKQNGKSAQDIWEANQYIDDADATFKNLNAGELSEGTNRNEYMYSFASSCFGKGFVYDRALKLCTDKNKSFKKPLSEKEMLTTLNSIYKRHKRKNNLQDYKELLSKVETVKDIKQNFPIIIKMIVNSEAMLKESEQQALIEVLAERTGIASSTIKKSIVKEKEVFEEDEKVSAEELFRKNAYIFEQYVYMCCEDRIRHLNMPTVYKPEAFSRKMSPLVKGVKGMPADLTRFLISNKIMKEADTFSYRPDVPNKFFIDEMGVRCVNSYLKPDLTPRIGSIKPVLNHFKKLIPNDNERETFLQYIAYLVQHRGKKIRWVIILKGAKGIGKSFISDVIISSILGQNNMTAVSTKSLVNNFNAWQEKAQLAICHELKLEGSSKFETKADLTDTLKSFITDNTVAIERKGVDVFQTRNITNLIAFTNHEDVVHLSNDERRYFMLRAKLHTPLSEAYYDDLSDWVGNNSDKVLNYFLNKSLNGFSANRAPSSEYTKEIKRNSAQWPEWVITDALESTKSVLGYNEIISREKIVEYVIHISEQNGMDKDMMQSLYNARSKSGHRLNRCLLENGFEYWEDFSGEKRLFVFGRRLVIYKTPKGAKRDKVITANKARKLIKAQSEKYQYSDFN